MDVGIRTFAIVALLGMVASVIGPNVAIASWIGVFLLVAAINTRSMLADKSVEITTSAALIPNYLLGFWSSWVIFSLRLPERSS